MHGPKTTVEFIKGVVTRNHNQGFSYSKKSKTIPNVVMVGMQMNRTTLQSTHQAPQQKKMKAVQSFDRTPLLLLKTYGKNVYTLSLLKT
jgi:hypothetical protein